MEHPMCQHLDEYGAQYVRTRASYLQFVDVMDRLFAAGPLPELVALAQDSLAAWAAEDEKLKQLLVEEVAKGHVRVPRGILGRGGVRAKQKRRQARARSHPVCALCRKNVPRLKYPEWKIAHNGVATFRGRELPVLPPVPA